MFTGSLECDLEPHASRKPLSSTRKPAPGEVRKAVAGPVLSPISDLPRYINMTVIKALL